MAVYQFKEILGSLVEKEKRRGEVLISIKFSMKTVENLESEFYTRVAWKVTSLTLYLNPITKHIDFRTQL